jgi:hypothetical protein
MTLLTRTIRCAWIRGVGLTPGKAMRKERYRQEIATLPDSFNRLNRFSSGAKFETMEKTGKIKLKRNDRFHCNQ